MKIEALYIYLLYIYIYVVEIEDKHAKFNKCCVIY